MLSFRIALLGGLMALTAGVVPAEASFTAFNLVGDAAYNDLAPPAPPLAFEAESRIGDRGGAGTWERGVGRNTASTSLSTNGQFNWQSGQSVPFVFSFNKTSATTADLTYTVGGQTLNWEITGVGGNTLADFNSIAIRTRGTASSTALVDNLALSLDGGAPVALTGFSSQSAGNGGGNAGYLIIQFEPGRSSFTLTGDTTLSWTGMPPNQSNLAVQFKVAAVPEPSSFAMIGVGLAGAVGAFARRLLRAGVA